MCWLAVAQSGRRVEVVPMSLLPARRIDPYLVWAVESDFAYLQAGDSQFDTVLIEAKASVAALAQWAQTLANADVRITPAYLDLPGGTTRRVCTAQVRRTLLRTWSPT